MFSLWKWVMWVLDWKVWSTAVPPSIDFTCQIWAENEQVFYPWEVGNAYFASNQDGAVHMICKWRVLTWIIFSVGMFLIFVKDYEFFEKILVPSNILRVSKFRRARYQKWFWKVFERLHGLSSLWKNAVFFWGEWVMKIEDKSKTKSGTVCFLCENESCGYWTGRCEVPRFPLRSILHVKSELKMNKFFTPKQC